MFENVDVKNLNARTFIIIYIDDTTSFENIFTSKFLLEFENFLKIESNASTKTQAKEKNSEKKTSRK